MTNTKYTFEQKRIDNVQWSGVSRLSSLPSLPNDGKSPSLKIPLFYLTSVSVNDYEDDIYFVNNTDQTLHFVAPFKLYRNLNEAGAKLGDVSVENLDKVTFYADDIDRLYTDVLPNQGVRIGSYHIMYDSDEMMQWFIDVPFKGVDSHNSDYAVWHFNVVEKGGIGGNYPLLWNDFSKPSHMVSCDCMSDRGEIPIEPLLYEERCWVLDSLTESLGVADALFVLAINDVLYRYCVGWSAPYNESDIQAKDIAHKLQELKPSDADAVKEIIQAVYDFWFNEGFAKNIPVKACAEIFDLYKEWVVNH
ncbi:hypothetical protein FQ082_07100 [Psychrobacter sp. ANT_H56B]|uniref:hypothetical protein n=1 Tax=Psychrobacter sp. ANT_H56B TaxID=2597353 RepID=UPI0011F30FEE|nr:hypothetical protein [Psychrobacter sp. ANT_H56B]KAA0926900.1 hypothetical protein FQ082_07100 [Psychrobacter sp. ANT_H56B]